LKKIIFNLEFGKKNFGILAFVNIGEKSISIFNVQCDFPKNISTLFFNSKYIPYYDRNICNHVFITIYFQVFLSIKNFRSKSDKNQKFWTEIKKVGQKSNQNTKFRTKIKKNKF